MGGTHKGPKGEIKTRNVSGQSMSPEMASFMDELQKLDLGFTLTSAHREGDHGSHGSGNAIDIGCQAHDNHSFLQYLFGKDFDPSKKVNGEYPRPDLTPEAVELFKKHNIRLIDERLADGGSHYHLERVDENTANTINEVGTEANFRTSATQGNADKNMYFYGGDQGVYNKNEYNQSENYKKKVKGGETVDISTMITPNTAGADTTKGTHILNWENQYEMGVKGTYDDWSEIERGDHEDGDIIKVGDKHYEYQDNRGSYAPHNIETGETEDMWDNDPDLITPDTIGKNPEKLLDGSKNPKYRKNRDKEGRYIYKTIQHVKKDKRKLQEGDVIIVDGKEYRYDSETKDLILFNETGDIIPEGTINVNNINAETTTEVVEKAEIKGTYNDWTEIEKGDVLDGEVIKVGDNFYQYQGSSTYYIPYDLETGEREIAVDRGQYVSDSHIGKNPVYLLDNSLNPKYKKEEEKDLKPLSDLTEEEINNLTDEERKAYGLTSDVDVEPEVVEPEVVEDEVVEEVDLEKYNKNKEILKDSKFKTQAEWDAALKKAEDRVEKEKNNRILIGGNRDDEGYLPGYEPEQVERAERELAEIQEQKQAFESANNYNSNYSADDIEAAEPEATHDSWEDFLSDVEGETSQDKAKLVASVYSHVNIGGVDYKWNGTAWVNNDGVDAVLPERVATTETSVEVEPRKTTLTEEEQDILDNYSIDGTVGEGKAEIKNSEGKTVAYLEGNKLLAKKTLPLLGEQTWEIGEYVDNGDGTYTFKEGKDYNAAMRVASKEDKEVINTFRKAAEDNPQFAKDIINTTEGNETNMSGGDIRTSATTFTEGTETEEYPPVPDYDTPEGKAFTGKGRSDQAGGEFVGEFKNGLPTKGKITRDDGTIQEGVWDKNGNFSEGTTTYPNGDVYVGSVSTEGDNYGKPNGGTLTRANGSRVDIDPLGNELDLIVPGDQEAVQASTRVIPNNQAEIDNAALVDNGDGTYTRTNDDGSTDVLVQGLDANGDSVLVVQADGTDIPEGVTIARHPDVNHPSNTNNQPGDVDPVTGLVWGGTFDNPSWVKPEGTSETAVWNGTEWAEPEVESTVTAPGETSEITTVEPASSGQNTSPEQQAIFNNVLKGAGGAASSLLQGAGALLDQVGGPAGIISLIMGKKGLEASMKEIKPQAQPQLSPMFMQHLRQTRELAKKGFHPNEAKAIRKGIGQAYQKGLENAVRGSGGQRARFLAQSGVLDAQRSSALLEYAVKDEELQRKNAEGYEKMMLFKENFDINKTATERAEDMERQLKDKEAAAGFTSAAFTSLMNSYSSGKNSAMINQAMNMFKDGEGMSQFFNSIQNWGNQNNNNNNTGG